MALTLDAGALIAADRVVHALIKQATDEMTVADQSLAVAA